MTFRRLHGLSAGSSAATHLPTPLRELFEGHAPFVCRSLGYLGVPEDGLDAALRNVFSLVFQQLDEYQKQARVRAWLYSLCARVSRAHGHRRPSRQREAFLLYELEDMPLAEVAQALHCTPRTAYARLRAARARALELAALSGAMELQARGQ